MLSVQFYKALGGKHRLIAGKHVLAIGKHVLIVVKLAYLHGEIGGALTGDSEDRINYTYLHSDTIDTILRVTCVCYTYFLYKYVKLT